MNAGRYLDWLRSLPTTDPAQLLRDRALLVLAPHPDDESLGCGNLIAWATARGIPVTIVFLTHGERSHAGSLAFTSDALAWLRRNEAITAAMHLGVPIERLHFLGLPDGSLGQMDDDALGAIHFSLLGLVATPAPPLICVTSRTDPHGDHQAAWLIAHRLAQRCGAEVLSFPVWTWMLDPQREIANPARRAWRLPAGDRTHKRAAIAAHRSQLGEIIRDAATTFTIPEALLDIARMHDEVLIDERLRP
jgi:LmbE family N-acetylglucosaminyl deacetylase